MAASTADNMVVRASGFNSLNVLRQLGLMVGLAVSVALGVTVAMWSQTPNYSILYGDLSIKDMAQVTKSLETAGIEYKIEGGSGISVPADKLQDARMKLSATSLAPNGVVGYELLDKNQGLGSNSFLMKARYQRALEGEIAQSISKLNLISSARVHLAIPKRSAFSRKGSNPAASVVINVAPGWVIDDAQTASIVNIVASSVPGLMAENVTVVDGSGKLLSSRGAGSDMMVSSTQFAYTRKLEERYVRRIIDMISPISGADGVRAQVVAEIDFTTLEETKESYLPNQKVVRSEQLFEQKTNQPETAGVPGALSNQPPVGGTVDGSGIEQSANAASSNNSSRAVRNYEIDKTISHTRQSPVELKRLSVAVIIDYKTIVSKKGKVTREAISEAELQRLTTLIKEAVGFNESRGDTINLVNTEFLLPEEVEPLPEPPIWEQAWALDLAKQLLGGLVVLWIAFGVLRPMLKNLSTQGELVSENLTALPAGAVGGDGEHIVQGEDQLTLSNKQPSNGQQLMDVASSMVKEDPKRVAKVLNTWVEQDG